MNTLNKVISLISTFVFLASCQSTILFEASEDAERVPVTLNAEITAATRASDDQWQDGDRIGIYMFDANKTLSSSSVIDESINRKYSCLNGSFTPCTSNDTLFYPTTGSISLIAYYPYRSVKDFNVSLDVSNQSSQSALDFLYSNNVTGVTSSTEAQTLFFHHQLTQVKFKISADTGFTDSDLKGLTLEVEDVYAQADFDLSSGELTIAEGASLTNITADTNESGTSAEMIMIPQEVNQKLVRVTLDSRRSYTFAITTEKWAAEKKYTYKIALKKDYLSASGLVAVITSWGEGEESDLSQDGGSTLNSSVWDGTTVDDTWYDSELTEFKITKASQLAGLASLVNNEKVTFEGQTILLLNNIDLNDYDWTPIGTDSQSSFNGTFNGNGHTISHIHPQVMESSTCLALFGNNQGTLKRVIVSGDLTYDLTTSVASNLVAMLVANNGGNVIDCRNYANLKYTATAKSSNAPSFYVGGLVGYNTGKVAQCQNCGIVDLSTTFTYQPASTSTETTTTPLANNYVGGVVGGNVGTVTYCDNNQSVHAFGDRSLVGGVVGCNAKNKLLVGAVSYCENYGEITSDASTSSVSLGGVVGKQEYGTLTDSHNYGTIKSTSGNSEYFPVSGGVVGTNAAQVYRCYNSGMVSATNSAKSSCAYAGGIAGSNTGEIHTSENETRGYVEASLYNGGITGLNIGGKVYSCCSNYGFPLRWNSTGSDANSKKDVTTDEHTDN